MNFSVISGEAARASGELLVIPLFEGETGEGSPGLLAQAHAALEARLLPRWRKVYGSGSFDEIEAFARELLELSRSQGWDALDAYAQALLAEVSQFNIESMQRQLDRLPELLAARESE